uniref:NADH dehydrogenase subunit 5 n=1 Tax=Bregmatothrips sinensis TaxID=3045418 RepID=UPI0030E44281
MNFIFCIMSFFFFFFFIIFFFLSFFMIGWNFSLLINWFFFSLDFFFCFPIFLDWVSCLFISMVFLISGSVIMYSDFYMNDEYYIENRFFYLLFFFVLSMFFLILSPNFFSMLLGWDGLGLISYCLVIFYQNSSSYCSGMLTVLANRLGDVFVISSICLSLSVGSMNYFLFLDSSNFLVSFFFLISSFTKSAQVPFSSWLPAAMAAPTPVSSLVHSSTLVTAGIYIVIRYSFFFSEVLKSFLFFFSVFTLIMAGLSGFVENDLKKIIALSTLSQLGFMMCSISLGLVDLAFFHLIVHACFKALMFMCAGCFIHFFLNVQDIRKFSLGSEYSNYDLIFLSLIFNISNLSLCGFPYLSGFFSKDMILEKVFMLDDSKSFFSFFFLVFGTFLTVMYGFRLFFYMVFKSGGFFFSLKSFSFYLSMGFKSMFFLFFFSIFLGFFGSNIFISPYYIFLPLFLKLMVLYVCLLGVFICFFFSFFSMKMKGFFLFFLGNLFFFGFLKTQFIIFKSFFLGVFSSKLLLGYIEWFIGMKVYNPLKSFVSSELNLSTYIFFFTFSLSFFYFIFFVFIFLI